jgi:RNA polymerase primary sigma factor
MFRSPGEKKDLEQYLKEVSSFPLLTPQREKELGVRIRQGDKEAVRELVESNLRFVVHYAKKYASPTVSLMDLISEGNLALLEAAKRFDPAKDARFVTYAGWWLRQAMLEAISKDHPLSLTPKTLGQIYRMERAAASLRRDLDRSPSLKELSEELGLKERDVQALQQAGMEFFSLSKSTGDDSGMELAETLPERDVPSPEFVMLKRSVEEEVRALVDELPPNEGAVIRQRFGLGGGDPASLQKIADRLHCSRERVRQLETRALRRMRALARGLKLEGFLR